MESHFETVEINGIKMQIDMRTATRIEHYRVGDRVKLLNLTEYSTAPEIYHGVIVGFENFATLPTIVIAYLNATYNTTEPLKLAYVNEKTKEKFQVVPDMDSTMPCERAQIEQAFNRAETDLLVRLADIQRRRDYFRARFGAVFPELAEEEVQNESCV